MPLTRIFALTTAGLEPIGAEEVARYPESSAVEAGYRRVAAAWDGALAPLVGLRTVDDVFVQAGQWSGIGRPRAVLPRLRALAAELDLWAAHGACASVRSIPPSPAFTVGASFVGRRNYGVAEIKAEVAAGIARATGWNYCQRDDQADLNVRVFIEHEEAHVGLRLARSPLHERGYRREHRSGALKPSVAASLLALTDLRAGMRLLDPCSGTGTIAIEAALSGACAYGGDVDEDALAAARINAAAAGVAIGWCHLDMRALPFQSATLDRIVTNLPWDRQVSLPGDPTVFYRQSIGELWRVLAPGGRMAALTLEPDLLPAFGGFVSTVEISLFGQRPTVVLVTKPAAVTVAGIDPAESA